MKNSYYWSKDWSEAFYIALAKKGFISTSYDTPDGLLLLPELQYAYAVLDFENLHISHKVKRLLRKKKYILCINEHFEEVLERIQTQHKYNWLTGEYVTLMKNLFSKNGTYQDFELMSVTLFSKESKEIIAGEIGYKIAKTYTSLSGFSSREKEHNNCGTLQLVLLAQYLQKEGYDFWNLGHPHMEYKKQLGCTVLARNDFLQRWNKNIQGTNR